MGYVEIFEMNSEGAGWVSLENASADTKIGATAVPTITADQTSTLSQSSPFSATPNTQSTWSIDFEFNDVDSLATFSSTTKINGADIDVGSRDYSSLYDDAYIADKNLEPLIFDLGQKYVIAGSISNYTYSYKRLYASQSFTSGASAALTVGSGEAIAPATSTSEKPQKYQIVVTSAGTSPYTVGQIIPSNLYTIDTGTRIISVTNGGNMTANIIATIDVTSPTAKTKTLVAANSTVQTSGGTSIFANNGVITYTTQGQVHIMANTVYKTPDTVQSLFVPDVISLVQVLDFNGNQITVANSSTATDITSRYTLDTGQRDSYYDHASIKLKPGVTTPTGPLVVKYNRHSSAAYPGFFTVDSYPTYANIPFYTSATTGNIYELRDSLDYRPVRSIPTTAGSCRSGSSITS